VSVAGGAGLATLNSAVANPEKHYVNLHTTVYGGGAVRSQLGAAATGAPTIAAVISAVSDPNRRTLAPGGLFTVFGSNLTRVAATLSAFSGQSLPSSLNGVGVSVGGRAAPLIQVTPGYIVAQVPFETAPGSVPVMVTSPAGRSAAVNVTVAATAPAIYFDAEGAIATDLSYRLIRSTNAARAGDRVWVYSTGMGQASPALQNGSLALTYGTVSGVTATVGGRPANVIAAVSSPGFAGVYQTLIEIPSGLAPGNQPVVLTLGGNSSNSAMIPVR
jgi:adhesin/invasin